ncbi:ParA family protein [Bordetella genomosp. 5]|uniref:AAA domain-containing protein n=1 Tax=Bordetella genomosp. 5 TaxID=1395608 RepID=A0A261TAG8_9BORD|nr:AAA family ATPase [Bordetella genomosp. 5]OZI46589.1 hypothetical protein CAL25_17965 [Bordetella genomosp. 5]
MAKVICLFNHKGGVSKTTTAFNLGWMMARMGKKVILADFDPQCNLTGLALELDSDDGDLEDFYSANPPNNVKDGLAPAFESQPRLIAGADCYQVGDNPNLLLLAGHIGLSEYETNLGVAQELSGSLITLRNVPGSLRYLLDRTAEDYHADYILVDMSPSLGPVNQNLLMTCDYFMVPMHPDYFSGMALKSLARTLPKWKHWAETAYRLDILANADYPFPRPHPQFIGTIIQKYRPRGGKASKAFQTWINRLKEDVGNGLLPVLISTGMLDTADYIDKVHQEPYEPIMEVADFNSLIAFSQKHRVPVFEITEKLAEQAGSVWAQTKRNKEAFEAAFRLCAKRVFALTA